MGSSSSDSRPTVPPPFDVARYARDSDARVEPHPSDEYEIEIESSVRAIAGLGSGVRRTAPPPDGDRLTPISPYDAPGRLDSVGSLEVFMDSDPIEDLFASVEIEVAEESDPRATSIRPSSEPRPRTSSLLPRESLHQIPTLATGGTGIERIGGLDPRAAFLLSRFDGYSDLETVVDISGMPTSEAMDILSWLVEEGIVVLA